MANEDPSLKRARCENGDTEPKNALTVDSFLEERVRLWVSQALSSHSPSTTAPPAETSFCRQELAACRSDIAAQKGEIEVLKKEVEVTRNLVHNLQKTIKGLKSTPAQSERMREGQAPGAELEGPLSLKIGSRKFQTTAETLRNFPESFFGLMVSGRVPQKHEKDGSIFVDRNAKHFSFILDYLRSGGEGFTPPTSTSAQDELRVEADFYGLPGLVTLLRRLHVAAHHLMTIGKKGAVLSGHKLAAAMLDVQDPNNFGVTFAFGDIKFSSCPYFVGVAPLDTHLPSEWVKRQFGRQPHRKQLECPPAVDHGLFFVVDGSSAGLMTASDGNLQERMGRTWRDYSDDAIESVRMCFNRDVAACRITFHVNVSQPVHGKSPKTMKWDTSIGDHGLPSTGDFRPTLFLMESGTVTINELAG